MSIVKIRAALESAIAAMPGLVPSVAITASASGSFTTDGPHQLKSGVNVSISGHSVLALNGQFLIVVTGANTFTLQHPATKAPITSTASGVAGVLAANLTAWEGLSFAPVAGVPYQRIHMLQGMPENPSFGGSHVREQGLLQVTLCYPNQRGTNAVMTRAELIRSTFPRGSSFTNSGVTVHIPGTPEIMSSHIEDESIVVPVRIPYWADIFN